MGQMRILVPTQGDELVEWDPKNEEEVEKAKAKFEEMTAQGHKAYEVERKATRKGKPVKKFNKKVGEYLLVPAMAGGC